MPHPALISPLICRVAMVADAAAVPSVEQSGTVGEKAQAFDAGATTIMHAAEVTGKAGELRRVIVTLRLDGYEPTNKVAIAAVQDRIISAVTKPGVTVERKYFNTPRIALTLTPQALAELRRAINNL